MMWKVTVLWMWLSGSWMGAAPLHALSLLQIGAIDAVDVTQPQEASRTQSISYNATSGVNIEVKIIWSFARLKENFSILKQARSLVESSVDMLVLNDVFYGSLNEQHHLDLLDTPVVHFQAKSNSSSSSSPAVVWPDVDVAPMCGVVSNVASGQPYGQNICNDDQSVPSEGQLTVPSKIDVVLSVLKYLHWDTMVILFEDEMALEAKQLSNRLSVDNTTYQVYNVKAYMNSSGIHHLLTIIYDVTITSYNDKIQIVMLCSDSTVSALLSEANIFDDQNGKKTALKLTSKWLITLPGNNQANVETCGMDMDNIAVLSYPPLPLGPVLDMSEGLPLTLENVLQKIGSMNDTQNMTVEELKQNASDTFIRMVDSKLLCWKSDVSTLLWETGGIRKLSPVGYVNRTGDLNMYDRVEIFPNRKFGFNSRLFNVSTNVWKPFVGWKDNSTDELEGFCIDLLEELSKALNFTYELVLPPDREEWGQLANGSWTGLVGQLEREEVDLVVAPLAIQPDREKVMDFIFPFFYEYTTVLIQKPDPNRTKWRTLIDPFKWQVLMWIGIALLGVTTFYFLLERWNPFYEGKKSNAVPGRLFGDAFWYMYGALLTQGGEHLPDSQAGRTVVSCWWLFSIVMAATYSGNLIAFLTVNKDKLPFETLAGMVEQTDYQWGTAGGTYWTMLFEVLHKKSNITEYKKVWDGIKQFNLTDPRVLSPDPEVHLSKVQEGGYAYVADRSMMEIWQANSCDLAIIKDNFFPLQYAIGLPNNSAYAKIFSEEMLKIYESGLLQIWKKRWWPKNSFCKGALTTEAKKITLIDVQSAFYLIGLGIVLAGLALGCEWLTRYIDCRRKPKPLNLNGHLPKYANGYK